MKSLARATVAPTRSRYGVAAYFWMAIVVTGAIYLIFFA